MLGFLDLSLPYLLLLIVTVRYKVHKTSTPRTSPHGIPATGPYQICQPNQVEVVLFQLHISTCYNGSSSSLSIFGLPIFGLFPTVHSIPYHSQFELCQAPLEFWRPSPRPLAFAEAREKARARTSRMRPNKAKVTRIMSQRLGASRSRTVTTVAPRL